MALLLSFLFNAFICTAIEFAMGMMLNQPDANGVYPLWDYSTMFCNFMGQVCLQNALAFGAVSTLLTWVIYPLMEKALSPIAPNAMNVAFIGVVVAFSVLFFFYCINVALPDISDDGSINSSPYATVESSSSSSSDTNDAGKHGVFIDIPDGSSSSNASVVVTVQ